MRKRKIRFPAYASVVGPGSEIRGALSFSGGLHVDGRILGDVTGEPGKSGSGSAMSLAASGVIEGNLNVPYVVIDGTVVGDVRAWQRAILASGARIQGTVYYGSLEMDEGAEVNGQLVHIEQKGETDAAGRAKAPPKVADNRSGQAPSDGPEPESGSG